MLCLSIDIGTTHWKAAIVYADGRMGRVLRVASPIRRNDAQHWYEPAELLPALTTLFSALSVPLKRRIGCIALTGMAEAGLLLDADTAQPLSNIFPWYDQRSLPYFETLRQDPLFEHRHNTTGLPNSYKYGIYKLLCALEQSAASPATVRWLGIVEYVAFLLTGVYSAEQTFAARTYAYDILNGQWDAAFLAHAGLPGTVFPPVRPSGAYVGDILAHTAQAIGVAPNIPVLLCGHDHLCAAYGAGAAQPGQCFASMGTAQVLIANRATKTLSEADAQSGLSFGPALDDEGLTVLGSVQSAGGSINLLRTLLYRDAGYRAMLRDVQCVPDIPSGLLYYPYLAGSGAPHLDPTARGAVVGLSTDTTRGRIVLAAYEGIAMECKFILENPAMGQAEALTACGGLTAHPRYLQILADVLGLPVSISGQAEGSLYGAARLALSRLGDDLPIPALKATYVPRLQRTMDYASIYSEQYLPRMPLTSALPTT